MRKLIAIAGLTLLATPALSGGWEGGYDTTGAGALVSCAALSGQHVARGTTCLDANGDVVVANVDFEAGTVVEVRRGLLCPYPYRPSDSVFIGGAGYLLKDTVRARLGCL